MSEIEKDLNYSMGRGQVYQGYCPDFPPFLSDAVIIFRTISMDTTYIYQPSGEGGTRSPPAKSKMAARGLQNG